MSEVREVKFYVGSVTAWLKVSLISPSWETEEIFTLRGTVDYVVFGLVLSFLLSVDCWAGLSSLASIVVLVC